MNEIWLVYAHKNYTYDISDIVSYADYEEEADEQIARFQNICNQEPTINVEEKLEEIRKSLDHIENDGEYSLAVHNAKTKYINSIPFEEYLKWKYGKNAKFRKTTIKRDSYK